MFNLLFNNLKTNHLFRGILTETIVDNISHR